MDFLLGTPDTWGGRAEQYSEKAKLLRGEDSLGQVLKTGYQIVRNLVGEEASSPAFLILPP